MNRNAARHLALVVSILLCFFVYMGYRYWGMSESIPENGNLFPPTDSGFASSPGTNSSGNAGGLRPGNDNTGSLSLAPPPGNGTSERSGSAAPSDVSYPIGSIDEQLSLSSPSGMPLPPTGSVEESATGAGEITGLVPSAPLTPPSDGRAPPSGGAASSGEDMLPSFSPPSGVSLKPPGGEPPDGGAASSPLPPPPAIGTRSGAGADSLTPPTAFPGSTTTRTPTVTDATELRGGSPLPTPPLPRSNDTTTTSPPRPGSATPVVPPITRPSTPVGPSITPTGGMPVSDSLRIYVVQPGDTLSRIAARELGSIALADNIFLLNRDVISDPDHLMAGVRIRLPVRETLGGTAGVPGTGESERRVVHRVQRGETLSSIAVRYYGTRAAWQFLHQANASVLPNPDQLSVGMELIIPPYEELQ